MRRCLVGFSSPVGYGYKKQANRTINDGHSSPNPFLLAATGMFTLYDEIWFACESLCPQNMRNLEYVKFLDQEFPTDLVKGAGINEALNFVDFPERDASGEVFRKLYDSIPEIFGEDLNIDNHTHGLMVFGENLSGNQTVRNLAVDLLLLRTFHQLQFELIFNPISASLAFGNDGTSVWPFRNNIYQELRHADRIVSLNSFRDYSSPMGPHYDVIEQIRKDGTVKDFRRWLSSETDRWGNRTVEDIEAEVDEKLEEIQVRALGEWESRYRLSRLGVDLIKGAISPLYRVGEFAGLRPSAKEQIAYSFIARAHVAQRHSSIV